MGATGSKIESTVRGWSTAEACSAAASGTAVVDLAVPRYADENDVREVCLTPGVSHYSSAKTKASGTETSCTVCPELSEIQTFNTADCSGEAALTKIYEWQLVDRSTSQGTRSTCMSNGKDNGGHVHGYGAKLFSESACAPPRAELQKDGTTSTIGEQSGVLEPSSSAGQYNLKTIQKFDFYSGTPWDSGYKYGMNDAVSSVCLKPQTRVHLFADKGSKGDIQMIANNTNVSRCYSLVNSVMNDRASSIQVFEDNGLQQNIVEACGKSNAAHYSIVVQSGKGAPATATCARCPELTALYTYDNASTPCSDSRVVDVKYYPGALAKDDPRISYDDACDVPNSYFYAVKSGANGGTTVECSRCPAVATVTAFPYLNCLEEQHVSKTPRSEMAAKIATLLNNGHSISTYPLPLLAELQELVEPLESTEFRNQRCEDLARNRYFRPYEKFTQGLNKFGLDLTLSQAKELISLVKIYTQERADAPGKSTRIHGGEANNIDDQLSKAIVAGCQTTFDKYEYQRPPNESDGLRWDLKNIQLTKGIPYKSVSISPTTWLGGAGAIKGTACMPCEFLNYKFEEYSDVECKSKIAERTFKCLSMEDCMTDSMLPMMKAGCRDEFSYYTLTKEKCTVDGCELMEYPSCTRVKPPGLHLDGTMQELAIEAEEATLEIEADVDELEAGLVADLQLAINLADDFVACSCA